MFDDTYVTLERYKTDLACYKAKNDFIASKIRDFLAPFRQGEEFLRTTDELDLYNEIGYVLELLETPAGMFISDEEWKKAGIR